MIYAFNFEYGVCEMRNLLEVSGLKDNFIYADFSGGNLFVSGVSDYCKEVWGYDSESHNLISTNDYSGASDFNGVQVMLDYVDAVENNEEALQLTYYNLGWWDKMMEYDILQKSYGTLTLYSVRDIDYSRFKSVQYYALLGDIVYDLGVKRVAYNEPASVIGVSKDKRYVVVDTSGDYILFDAKTGDALRFISSIKGLRKLADSCKSSVRAFKRNLLFQ